MLQHFENAPKLKSNEHLRLASTFHSFYAIAANLAPVQSAGIEVLESDTFKLHCFQTATGQSLHSNEHSAVFMWNLRFWTLLQESSFF